MSFLTLSPEHSPALGGPDRRSCSPPLWWGPRWSWSGSWPWTDSDDSAGSVLGKVKRVLSGLMVRLGWVQQQGPSPAASMVFSQDCCHPNPVKQWIHSFLNPRRLRAQLPLARVQKRRSGLELWQQEGFLSPRATRGISMLMGPWGPTSSASWSPRTLLPTGH